MNEDERRDFETVLNRRLKNKTVYRVDVSHDGPIRIEFNDGLVLTVSELSWKEYPSEEAT